MDSNKKVFDLTNPKDIEEVQRILFEDSDENLEEDFEDEVDTEGEDATEIRQEDSEMEEDDDENEGVITEKDENYFFGKDGETKWNKNPPSSRIRSRSCNLLRKLLKL